MTRRLLPTLASLLFLAAPALADEMWAATGGGMVIYEQDAGDTAILSFPKGAASARLYIPGLVGKLDSRDVHQAYWIGAPEGTCGATLTGPDGWAGSDWGLATVAFDAAGFPSGFTATLGSCTSAPFMSLRASVP